MNFDQFYSVNVNLWNKYYNAKSKIHFNGIKILFPNILILTETSDFYITELIGCSPTFEKIKVKKNKAKSINEYLFHTNDEYKSIQPDNSNILFNNFHTYGFYLGHGLDKNMRDFFQIDERIYGSGLWSNRLESNRMIDFGKRNFLELKLCCIVNRYNNTFKIKNVNYIHIIAKHIPKNHYKKFLIKETSNQIRQLSDFKGVQFTDNVNLENKMIFHQFLNIYSFNKLHETTIGDFLNNHRIILKQAFNIKEVIYEPELEWIEGIPDENEKYINPDFILKKSDNTFDILDLKLPYWDKKKLTKGKRKRRSFLQIVDEGLSQLANYEDYFNYNLNESYALKKYGLKHVKIKLILIIGNYSNYDSNLIKEASRKLKDNFIIMDYDTLNQTFLNSINRKLFK